MLDVTALPLEAETQTSKPCAQCGTRFEPRTGSGGSPQRFCDPDCRQRYQRDQRVSSPALPACHPSVSAPLGDADLKDAPAAAPANDESDDFDWSADEAVILRDQPATAIYFNPHDGLVIRQRGEYPDEDKYVHVNHENIDAFVDRVLELVGRSK